MRMVREGSQNLAEMLARSKVKEIQSVWKGGL